MPYLTPPEWTPGDAHDWLLIPVPAQSEWLAIVIGQLYALADDWLYEQVGGTLEETLEIAEEIHHARIILDSLTQNVAISGASATENRKSRVNAGNASSIAVWRMDNGNA